jgi:protein-tyrosine phosphatase
MSFYNQIIPNLYLGSIEASRDHEFIHSKNISVIINCSKDIIDTYSLNLLKPIEEAPQEVQDWLYNNSYYIKYYRIPVDDSGRQKDVDDFYNLVIPLLPLIKKEYDMGKNILVHCSAGAQRSPSFVCAFMMYYYNISLQKSIDYVIEKKPNVFFFGSNNHFFDALVKIEKNLIIKNNTNKIQSQILP